MMFSEILEQIKEKKLIVIARGLPDESVENVVETLILAGINLVELTFNQSSADPISENKRLIRHVCDVAGNRLLIGAGTVLSIDQVQAAYEAGARYIISPNTNLAVINETKRLNLVSIPGAMTPSEIMLAWDTGADMVKLFPADDLGYHYIRNIRAPISHVPLVATGGVNPETIPLFLNAGVTAVGTGISILQPELVRSGDFSTIRRLAVKHVEAINSWVRDRIQ